jgi:ABC-type Na+ efflux pump permease subunit
MRDSALRSLVLLELRRVERPLRRTLGLAAGAAVAISVLGLATPGRMAFIFMVLGMTFLSTPVMGVVKDKLDGGLEFLVALPVDRSVLAAARLAAGSLLAVAGGLCLCAGLWLVARPSLPVTPSRSLALTMCGVVTVGAALSVGLGTGVSLRMRASRFANLLFAGFLVALLAGELARRAIPGGAAVFLPLMGEPWFPPALAIALGLLVGFASWLAYWLCRTGLERFRPERDEATW